jgi:dolichol-phosphate mannosyltransferase
MRNTRQILVIVPTYNERENVPELVRQIFTFLPAAHVLLVDDNSPDGTAELAEELFGQDPRFAVLRRTGSRGLGRSYVDGYRYAMEHGYAQTIQMDADFSHDPAALPGLVRACETANVVIGSRYCAGGGIGNWPLRRRLLSRFANFYVSALTGLGIRDATSGFRCYSRYAVELLLAHEIMAEGYAFQVEAAYRVCAAGLSVAEVPITFVDRREGKSKISRAVIFESMLMPWRLRLGRCAAPVAAGQGFAPKHQSFPAGLD